MHNLFRLFLLTEIVQALREPKHHILLQIGIGKHFFCVFDHLRVFFEIDDERQDHKDVFNPVVLFFENIVKSRISLGHLFFHKVGSCKRAFDGKVVAVFLEHLLRIGDDTVNVVFHHQRHKHHVICRALALCAPGDLVNDSDCLVEFSVAHKLVRLGNERFIIVFAARIHHLELAFFLGRIEKSVGDLDVIGVLDVAKIILCNVRHIEICKIDRQLIKNAPLIVLTRMTSQRLEKSRIGNIPRSQRRVHHRTRNRRVDKARVKCQRLVEIRDAFFGFAL